MVALLFLVVCYIVERYKKRVAQKGDAEVLIPHSYEIDFTLIRQRIHDYEELKDRTRPEDADDDDSWMATLENKEPLKRLLMAKAVPILHTYQKTTEKQKGFSKMFSRHVITKSYWDSFQETIASLSMELEAIKEDIISLDPGINPGAVFQEAVRLSQRFGHEWPEGQANQCNCGHSHGPPEGTEAHHHHHHHGEENMPEPRQIKLGPFGNIKTDGWTWRQHPPPTEEVELQVSVPTGTRPSQVKVEFTTETVCVKLEDKTIFTRTFREKLRPQESTWNIVDDPFAVDDDVEMSGLSNVEFNGLLGVLLEPTAEQKKKGRRRVGLQDGRELSIKDENIIPRNEKGRVVISLEKVESKPWNHPPWRDGELG
eukprot:GEMP01021954.1.p1 GENE.GEMP01021954.1~~GEMP01021954.1.p1  ORF type:complete len:398 (+),score=67.04 GEMP01021954.1:86-1195(+)